jgi:hypothetical protein
VNILEPSEWKKLFGRKKDECRQLFTRISYLSVQEIHGTTGPVTEFFYPFNFEQFIRVTAISAKTHFSEDKLWLHNWNITDICILDVNKPTPQEHKPMAVSKNHTKRTIDALSALERVSNLKFNTYGLYGLNRHIHKLQQLKSLTINLLDFTWLHYDRSDWKELFKGLTELWNLKYLDIMCIPPDGNFDFPTLRHIHLRYYSKGRYFKLSAPQLYSLAMTQQYTTEGFDHDVESVLNSIKSTSLHSVEINFNRMNDISRVLSVNVMPSTVTSCRLGFTGVREMVWFRNDQVQFRSIEMNVSRKIASRLLKQLRQQSLIQVLSFQELDVHKDTFSFVQHLPHLHLIKVDSGHVTFVNAPKGVTVELGSKVVRIK